MSGIVYSEVACPSCVKYEDCKRIEAMHAETLRNNGGNWRDVWEGSRRVQSPIRRCALAWTELQLHDVNNIKMLEIGCGASREISEKFCVNRNIEYVGVDESLPFHGIKKIPFHGIQQKLTMNICKLLNIRKMHKINSHQRFIRDIFPTKHVNGCSFDVIYGNSTIEHWHEKNKDIDISLSRYNKDINVCYDLLVPGGKLLMSCPIYVHGNHIFMHGHTSMIEEMFSGNWSSVTFDVWRKSHGDLLPYCPDARRKHFKEAFDIDVDNIYLINVTAIK